MRRWIQNWPVSVALLLVLFIDAQTTHRHSPLGTIVSGRFIESMGRCVRCCTFFSSMYITRTDDGVVVEYEFDEIADDQGMVSVLPPLHGWTRGWWAATRRVTVHKMYIDPLGSQPYSQTELQDVRAQAVQLLVIHELPTGRDTDRYVAALALGDGTYSNVLWWGYIHNSGALLLVGSLFYSLGWILVPIRASRRQTRLRQQTCPVCAYDIRGLESNQCPECGETWTDAEASLFSSRECRTQIQPEIDG